MGGWIDGWVDGWTDGWMGGWINDELPPMHSVLGSNQQLELWAGGAPPGKWTALFRALFNLRFPTPHSGWPVLTQAHFKSSAELSIHFQGLSPFLPSTTHQMGSILYLPYCSWGNWSSERWRPFSKVTDWVNSWAEISTKANIRSESFLKLVNIG